MWLTVFTLWHTHDDGRNFEKNTQKVMAIMRKYVFNFLLMSSATNMGRMSYSKISPPM